MTARRAAAPESAPDQPRWIDYQPVAQLVSAERNPKAHDDALLDRSLARFGFVEPPSVDERTGRLIAGHGRLEALKRAEAAGKPDGYEGPWPPQSIVVADDGTWLLPVTRGWSSADDVEAEDYVVVANQSAMAGGWVERSLAEYLHDVTGRAGDDGLEAVGFDRDGYDQLMQSTGLAGELAGGFLDDIAAGGNGDGDTEPAHGTSTDVVDLRLPMVDRQRDEAVALLRQHQRTLSEAGQPAGSLSETALQVLRTWTL